jgi:cytochrome c peroxidase
MRYLLSLTLLPVLSCVLHAQDLDAQLPQPSKQIPFQSEVPIRFVNRAQNADQWDKLPSFWTNAREKAVDPDTGLPVERKTVVIKVPLGLTQNPPIPVENPITLAKWALGKRLYFDTVMSSDGTVSCSS